MIVSVLFVATATVLTVNVAVVLPAVTVTDVPTLAEGSLEANVIIVPPVGAGPLIVTVPVVDAPPTSDVELRLSAVKVGALIAKEPDEVEPLSVAAIVEVVLALTATVVIVKDATVWPAGTVTVAGTVAAAVFEEDRLTTVPPVGAGVES